MCEYSGTPGVKPSRGVVRLLLQPFGKGGIVRIVYEVCSIVQDMIKGWGIARRLAD